MAFYSTVFGWIWTEGPDDGYQMGSIPVPDAEPRMNCGAMAMPPGVPEEAPSFWAVYFAVEDCDTSLALAQSLGGSVFLPAMDMGPGRFGGVIDPTGGMFFLGHFPQGQG